MEKIIVLSANIKIYILEWASTLLNIYALNNVIHIR